MATVKRRFVTKRTEWFNDNNHANKAPFYSPDNGRTLLIEPRLFQAWSQTDAIDLLRAKFDHVTASDAIVQLDCTDIEQAPEWFWTVYRTILARANACRWVQCIPGAHVIMLDTDTCHKLAAEYIEFLGADSLNTNDEMGSVNASSSSTSDWLVLEIDKYMQSRPMPADGYFVKCGTCSTKKHYPPEPVFSGREAVDHLMRAAPVVRSMRNGTAECVLLRPFLRDVSENNELRVFVRDGRVTGVSQQACYTFVPVMAMMANSADEIIRAAQACYDEFNSTLPAPHRFNHECTFDAYFTTDMNTGTILVELVEINSEMFVYGPAGASLFNWEDDPPPKPDESPVFYYVDVY